MRHFKQIEGLEKLHHEDL